MTIRLTNAMHAIEVEPPRPPTTYHLVFIGDQIVALSDTRKEALEAKRAFENVLAPRFTRDEAIAIVAKALDAAEWTWDPDAHKAVRLALEALAAAEVFVDSRCAECRDDHRVMTCEACGKQTMSDKLDAAGIR